MQEKNIKAGGAENEDSPMYDYLFRLSYENPIEAQAIDLIQNRDKLDYPTVKSFLLKKILRPGEKQNPETKIGPGGTGEDEIQKMLEKLAREIENLQKEMADMKGIKTQTLPEEKQQPSEGDLEQVSEDDMDLLGFDDSFADNLLSDMG